MKYFAAILVLAACAYAQSEKDEGRPARATYPIAGAYPTAYIAGAPAGYVHPGAAYVPGAAYAPAAYPAAYPTAYIAPAASVKAAQYQYVAPHAAAYVPHYASVPQPAYYPAGIKAVNV